MTALFVSWGLSWTRARASRGLNACANTTLGLRDHTSPSVSRRSAESHARQAARTMRRSVLALALVLGTALFPAPLRAFKENEFKKCAQTSFCARNRNVGHGSEFYVSAGSVVVSAASMTATVVHNPTGKHLQLQLTSHADGFVRITMDELPSVGRYRVPSDIVVSGWENKKAGVTEAVRTPASITLVTGESRIEVNYEPLSIAMSIRGQPALQFNSRQLFNFEARREKRVRCCPVRSRPPSRGPRYSGAVQLCGHASSPYRVMACADARGCPVSLVGHGRTGTQRACGRRRG
jgi:hypothetical protein